VAQVPSLYHVPPEMGHPSWLSPVYALRVPLPLNTLPVPVGAEPAVVVVGLLGVLVAAAEALVEGEVGAAAELEAGADEPAGVAGAKPN
jgi:hypothetical protein